jgi:AraC-like DNA-binding protein
MLEMTAATAGMTLLCALIGLYIVKKLSVNIYRPIAEVIGALRQHASSAESMEDMMYLKKSVLSVLEQNKELRQIVMDETADQHKTFFIKLLEKSYPIDFDFSREMRRLGLRAQACSYRAAACSLNQASVEDSAFSLGDESLLLFSVENIISETLPQDIWRIGARVDKLAAFLLDCGDIEGLAGHMREACENITKTLGISVTVAISEESGNVEEIPELFDNCRELMSHRLELETSVIIESMVRRGSQGQPLLMTPQSREQLIVHIRQGNCEGFASALDGLVSHVRACPIPAPETVYAVMLSILMDLNTVLEENGRSLNDVFGVAQNPFRELTHKETLTEISEYLKILQAKSAQLITERKEGKGNSLINSVIQYIQMNYKSDLRLSTVAEHAFLSPSYLSRLFKQEVGTNFIQYITKVRLEKSKELLRLPELSLAEIAAETQFGTDNNFIKVFKKHEGMTPGQYRVTLAKNKLVKEGGPS